MFLSFFALLTSQIADYVETPEMLNKILVNNYELMEDVIFKQLYLSDNGVSFDYTDTLDMFQLDTLVELTKKWNDLKRQNAKNAKSIM